MSQSDSAPTETAFSLKKKKDRRGKSKNAKAVSGEAQRGLAYARRRDSFTVPLELGSRESVKLHHFGKRTEIAALWGGFFSGGAQRQPAVFLGGMRFGAPASWRTFLFFGRHSRHAPRRGKIAVDTINQ